MRSAATPQSSLHSVQGTAAAAAAFVDSLCELDKSVAESMLVTCDVYRGAVHMPSQHSPTSAPAACREHLFTTKMTSETYVPCTQTPCRRFKDYEVRSYPSFIVAQCAMDSSSTSGGSSPGVNPAGPGTLAFNKLAGYIFGKNNRGQRMSMTTPVFSSSAGTMQFVIPPSTAKVSCWGHRKRCHGGSRDF